MAVYVAATMDADPGGRPRHLDSAAAAKGTFTGLAELALVGVGHFTVPRVGGEVGSTFRAAAPVPSELSLMTFMIRFRSRH